MPDNNNNNVNMLSDRDMVLDMLTGQKHLCHIFNQAVLEASRNSVRDTLQRILHEEQQIAYRLYKAMEQRGWHLNSTTAGYVRRRPELRSRKQSMANPAQKVIPQADNSRVHTPVHTVEAALQKSVQRERRVYETPPWDLM